MSSSGPDHGQADIEAILRLRKLIVEGSLQGFGGGLSREGFAIIAGGAKILGGSGITFQFHEKDKCFRVCEPGHSESEDFSRASDYFKKRT